MKDERKLGFYYWKQYELRLSGYNEGIISVVPEWCDEDEAIERANALRRLCDLPKKILEGGCK